MIDIYFCAVCLLQEVVIVYVLSVHIPTSTCLYHCQLYVPLYQLKLPLVGLGFAAVSWFVYIRCSDIVDPRQTRTRYQQETHHHHRRERHGNEVCLLFLYLYNSMSMQYTELYVYAMYITLYGCAMYLHIPPLFMCMPCTLLYVVYTAICLCALYIYSMVMLYLRYTHSVLCHHCIYFFMSMLCGHCRVYVRYTTIYHYILQCAVHFL